MKYPHIQYLIFLSFQWRQNYSKPKWLQIKCLHLYESKSPTQNKNFNMLTDLSSEKKKKREKVKTTQKIC